MSEYFSYPLTTQVTGEVRDALISRRYIGIIIVMNYITNIGLGELFSLTFLPVFVIAPSLVPHNSRPNHILTNLITSRVMPSRDSPWHLLIYTHQANAFMLYV